MDRNEADYVFALGNWQELPFKRQLHKIVKHTQIIRWKQPTNCLSVFNHFVGLSLKGIRWKTAFIKIPCPKFNRLKEVLSSCHSLIRVPNQVHLLWTAGYVGSNFITRLSVIYGSPRKDSVTNIEWAGVFTWAAK